MGAIVLCCLLLASLTVSAWAKSYRGYHVLSVRAEHQEHVRVLRDLDRTDKQVDFFTPPTRVRDTEVMVSPGHVQHVMATLRTANLTVKLLFADVQETLDAVMEENRGNMARAAGSRAERDGLLEAHTAFRRNDDVTRVLKNLAAAFPQVAQLKQLHRRTAEGREIHYLELGTAGNSKPVVFVEGLAHPREWIVTASLLYVMDSMLSGYQSGEPRAVDALTRYTWVIIPVVNPDGYQYTWDNDRFWRKNRVKISQSCYGVNLNRNYDIDFGNTDSSPDCNHHTYPGPSPFSEAETQGVKSLFMSLRARVQAFFSVHSYSQLVIHPWGYINDYSNQNASYLPSNAPELVTMALKLKGALALNGRVYRVGTAYDLLGYAASGAAEDWALVAKPGILAYCYELRPANYWEGGFVLSPSEIVPTGQEVLESFYTLADNM